MRLHKPPLKGVTPHGVGRCPQGRGDRSVRGGPAKLVEGFSRDVQLLVQSCRNRPAEFARCTRCPPGACQRRLPIISPDMLDFMEELLGMCRGRCPHRPADLPEGSDFLGLPCRNRPAEFARCTRCPPVACQRRLLPLPVFAVLFL